MSATAPLPGDKGIVIAAVCFGVLFWVALFAYLWAVTPAPPPIAKSLEEVIAHYGGCSAYLTAMRENDATFDRMMAEADLPGWRDDAPIRSAERALQTAKALKACRDMKAFEAADTKGHSDMPRP